MKKLLKSTLVAASVAAACGVQAADFNELTTTYSKQGTTSVNAVTTLDVQLTLGAEYTADDVITLELSAGELSDSFAAFPSQVVATAGTAPDLASITLGKLNSEDGKVLYRVTDIQTTSNQGITGAVVDFGAGVKVSGTAVSNLAAGESIDLASTSKTTSGFTFDSATEELAKVEDQINNLSTVAASNFDATIDVTRMREVFVDADGNEELTDSLVVNHAQKDASFSSWKNLVTEGEVTVEINGKFDGLTASQFTSAATKTAISDEKVTLTYPSTFTTDTITFTSGGQGSGVSLERQEFTVSGTQEYTITGDATTYEESLGTAIPAGEWKLNGANVNLPYVPYDNLQKPMAERALQQIIYVTNHGSQAGDIFVTAIDESGTTILNNVMIATIGAKEMKKVAGLITAELVAAGFDNGKLSIDVTVNAPNEDISVYAAYKHKAEADRGVIINDQYKGVK